ncbi:hypothetical protein ACQR1N_32465 [Bradyrhizobium sp. HKCCYLRH1073]|uniref:hypothetical protein n=1 Tax=unclassified Bradyrhizobium TaxID=2631580 RepID=UPI002916E18D|nr:MULTISPECIES: hypothetical protein [unclassified Bradyrhizobium]
MGPFPEARLGPQGLLAAQLPNHVNRVESQDLPQLNKLDDINPTLTRFHVGHPGLVDTHLFSQVDLSSTKLIPVIAISADVGSSS